MLTYYILCVCKKVNRKHVMLIIKAKFEGFAFPAIFKLPWPESLLWLNHGFSLVRLKCGRSHLSWTTSTVFCDGTRSTT